MSSNTARLARAPTAERSIAGTLTLTLLVVSAATNVILAVALNRARAAVDPSPFGTGWNAPAIRLRGTDGSLLSLDLRSGSVPVVFYWFSPSCSWCELNLPNFQALAAQAKGRYLFLPVSNSDLTSLREYVAKIHIRYPAYQINDSAIRWYRFRGTPETLVVSKTGSYINRWIGAYSPSILSDVEKTLSVRLPGVMKDSEREGATR